MKALLLAWLFISFLYGVDTICVWKEDEKKYRTTYTASGSTVFPETVGNFKLGNYLLLPSIITVCLWLIAEDLKERGKR